jgi:hypothetical protein
MFTRPSPAFSSFPFFFSAPQTQVFVQRFKCKSLVRNRYYKCTIPEIKVTLCGSCQSFFGLEEYEEHVLENGSCPFCRTDVDITNF